MRAQVTSMGDQFAIRVYPGNPYKHRLQFKIKVYDQYFREIPAIVRPHDPYIAGGAKRPVLVIVPFGEKFSKKIRICSQSIPFVSSQSQLRGQVCGRYIGRRAG